MSDFWNSMHNWHLVLPPSRPSARQLGLVTAVASTIDRWAPVAVLGSTPEFRDLLASLRFQNVFVLDRSQEFYHLMSGSRIYANPERLVLGDWLSTLSDFRSTFSLVLSDLTAGNIRYEDRPRFYTLIEDSLRIDGIFVDKHLTHPLPHLRLDNLEEKYLRLPVNLLYANHFSCEVLFCSELLDLREVVDTTLFYSYLAERWAHPRLSAFAHASRLITPEGCVWHYGPSWSQLVKGYCPRLRSLVCEGDDPGGPYEGRLRLSVLRRED